ncbi:SGNH/GDSL hydrolase family protein [Paraflavitalea pollutisoli]|uniref:SGNH/GDSL hydrolase family protein n=1 Tax=Paraflavitalea pollutisoli TaxID=3034143 RepID=UPI0023EC61F3|nr:SGNH/GDSL hydrolase family protein [Paraflavitalea sp. H1-2-19X]
MRLLATLLLLLSIARLPAQDSTWHTPTRIEGIAVRDSSHIFYRLPLSLKDSVRPVVWNLSLQTAGEFIHFRTSARSFEVRYGVANKTMGMPHMPSTGVSGLDLYIKDKDGQWNWMPPRYRFGDTCVYTYNNIGIAPGALVDFYLFLPLYNTVQWLSVGARTSESFSWVPELRGKPIVAYGTSIMQGAVTSRPGLTWTNVLSRQLDRLIINLGFSGNGRYEKPLFDHMAKVDAALYILDCMPNLTAEVLSQPDSVEKRIRYGVQTLRAAHPNTPILFTEYPNGDIPYYTDTALLRPRHAANAFLVKLFKTLQQEGVQQLYLLTEKEIGFDINSLTEMTHPNDIGMQQYAVAYEKKVREILREPKATGTARQPVSQYRDGFDWELRHAQIIERIQQTNPSTLLIGNSIINFWGGEPRSTKMPPVADSAWLRYMEPLRVQNAGFGYDRIENVLWRVYHGLLDDFRGQQIVVMIGTNNLSVNTDEEIVQGLSFLLQQIAVRKPGVKLTMVGILPRKGKEPRVRLLNQQIKRMATLQQVRFVDLSASFLLGQTINASLFQPDGLHPNSKGYEVLGKGLSGLIGR